MIKVGDTVKVLPGMPSGATASRHVGETFVVRSIDHNSLGIYAMGDDWAYGGVYFKYLEKVKPKPAKRIAAKTLRVKVDRPVGDITKIRLAEFAHEHDARQYVEALRQTYGENYVKGITIKRKKNKRSKD